MASSAAPGPAAAAAAPGPAAAAAPTPLAAEDNPVALMAEFTRILALSQEFERIKGIAAAAQLAYTPFEDPILTLEYRIENANERKDAADATTAAGAAIIAAETALIASLTSRKVVLETAAATVDLKAERDRTRKDAVDHARGQIDALKTATTFEGLDAAGAFQRASFFSVETPLPKTYAVYKTGTSEGSNGIIIPVVVVPDSSAVATEKMVIKTLKDTSDPIKFLTEVLLQWLTWLYERLAKVRGTEDDPDAGLYAIPGRPQMLFDAAQEMSCFLMAKLSKTIEDILKMKIQAIKGGYYVQTQESEQIDLLDISNMLYGQYRGS